MCFKCGAEHHSGRCNRDGNQEMKEYITKNNVVKCPNCNYGTEKAGGCNHMTCVKCRYDWCWVCRSKFTEMHFILGCPGGNFGLESNCFNFIVKLATIIFIPLCAFVFCFLILIFALFDSDDYCSCLTDMGCFSRFLIYVLILIPLICILSAIAAALSPLLIPW